jgi:hypothetical protein
MTAVANDASIAAADRGALTLVQQAKRDRRLTLVVTGRLAGLRISLRETMSLVTMPR